jgi:hypothetical protein
MRKTILTILGVAVLAGSVVQVSAAERRHVKKVYREPVPATQSFRNSNAYVPPAPPIGYDSGPRYTGGISAPAGQ